MNGNRLYREPNDWQTGDVITKLKMAKIESAIVAIAQEIITAAGTGSNNQEITLNERLDLMRENFTNDIQNITIDPDDLALEQDEDGLVYITFRGERSSVGIPLAGGSGGGGGSTSNAVMSMVNTSGWMSKTLPQDDNGTCEVSFNWSSLENGISTGAGTLTIVVNDVIKSIQNVDQGERTVELYPYLVVGTNNVILRLTDIYGTLKIIRFNITVAQMRISSSFNTSVPFEDDFTFTYIPVGSSSKTVHFVVDGTEIASAKTTANDMQQQQLIPAQSHGSHTLEVWFSSMLNGSSVDSNHLYYEFISLEEGNNNPIIASSFNTTSVKQYASVIIPYRVYVPNATEAEVQIYVDGVLNTTTTVDRTEQNFTFRATKAGSTTIEIRSGIATPKSFTLSVSASDIRVEAVTEGLELYLNAEGRSNGEENRDKWTYGSTTATLTGFNWRVNGWLTDSDGIPVLRVSDDARVTIPFKLFGVPMYNTGKTVEIEFATREVSDYSAEVIKCWHEYTTTAEVDDEENPGQKKTVQIINSDGLKITPQQVVFKSYTDSIDTVYKDNEHIRLSITIGEQGELSDSRLMLVYINGIMSKAEQYTSGASFAQLDPQNIIIGSNDCGIDIYNIRVYNHDLNRRQVLNNWIADTQIGTLLTDRYTRNDIYDANSGVITTETVPGNLPYFILNAPELPQYKDDKKIITGSYIDPTDSSKSFTFENCQINVQGTSSAPYFRKNYDMQFKGGFITSTGTINNYMLRNDSIPFNRFVLKADVASSESTNNTGLTMFYNDTCPYKTPEMVANSKVRWGIEGVPIAVFWYDTENNTTQFMGKYNFNLPKRAPAPYGYGNSDTLESWEVERNNSANVKFQDNDFTTTAVDKDGDTYPAWYDDFEARFPSDEWRDITKLNAFLTFIKSTDRANATNNNLPSSVTYTFDSTRTIADYSSDSSYTVETETLSGGAVRYNITFTKDTPAYRLSKFRAEFPNYAEIDSFVFYYLFTEMFTMIDSRAKNMFFGFNGGPSTTVLERKATAQPYDMDTAIGTNNSGRLMFGYSLEDTDTVSGLIAGDNTNTDAPVYNAQDSVLWMNVRDAFRANISAMYTTLRTGTEVWSYNKLETRYENHQAKWPEAMFNEDAWTKYIYPLLYAVTKDDDGNLIKTKEYLPMLQGSKTEQRKWWLYNRFRYMDSKFATGDAVKNQITMRVFHEGTISITPAIDMYTAVRWGAGTTPEVKRTTANNTVTYTYIPGTGVQEMETLIDSGDMITDLGDLSGLYPNELKFSKATKLKNLTIGSAATGYSNPNLKELDVQNSSLLETIDCRNCPNLTSTIYLEGSPRLKEAYFEGTSITGVDLVDGGAIEKLHLPSTVNTLTLLNLDKLTDLVIPSYAGLTRLMLSNMSNNIINPVTVLAAMPSNAEINIQGLNLEMTDAAAIESFLAQLDRMKGVTRDKNADGAWIYHPYDTAQASVSGKIHTASLTGEQVATYTAKYPYIVFDADTVTSELKYYSYDGETLLHTDYVAKNGNGTWNGSPTRASTAQYDYTFAGWSTTKDTTVVDPNATKNITGNRDVYAVYTATTRTYTVTWKNADGTTLETDNNVAYGSTPQYNGSTPTYQGQSAIGWTPAISTVTGNITYTASYKPTYTITFKNDNGTTLQTLTGVVEGTVPSYSGSPNPPVSGNGSEYTFIGWTPTIVAATANATYTAKYESPNPWPEVNAAIKNGSYKTKYSVGDTIKLVLDNGEYNGTATIVGIDKDVDADGNAIPLTFITTNLLQTSKAMNSSNTNANGYPATTVMKPWVDSLKSHMPATLQMMIKAASKTSYNYSGTQYTNNLELWIPSVREMFSATEATSSRESSGVDYNDVFNGSSVRVKRRNGSTAGYWLRSAYSGGSNGFCSVYSYGGFSHYGASTSDGVVLGFCVGAIRDPIDYNDSWDDVNTYIANGTYKSRYIPGDTVPITIGSEYTGKAQVVAIDTDVDENGNTIPITWITVDQLATTYNMNSNNTNSGGYPASAMKTYVDGLLTSMPAKVQSMIVPAVKTSYAYGSSTNYSGTYSLWIPSVREMFSEIEATNSRESNGPSYTDVFSSNSARVKKRNGSASYYWLRSASSSISYYFCGVNSSGSFNNSSASGSIGVVLGWCTKATT